MESYQTKLRTAQADVNQSIEAVKLAQLNLDDSNVKAPSAGIIQTRSVQTGQYVQAGAVIATLLRRDPMLLHFNVTTAEAPRLKVGMPVEFTLKESHQTYSAKITLVTGAADDESRLVPITAQIAAEHQFWLRPGTFAQVQIKLTSARQFPMIPQSAARPSDHGFLAYTVQNDVAHEHVLQLGMNTTDGFVEVQTGLDAGTLLVTRGVEALADGTKVHVVTDAQRGRPSKNHRRLRLPRAPLLRMVQCRNYSIILELQTPAMKIQKALHELYGRLHSPTGAGVDAHVGYNSLWSSVCHTHWRKPDAGRRRSQCNSNSNLGWRCA